MEWKLVNGAVNTTLLIMFKNWENLIWNFLKRLLKTFLNKLKRIGILWIKALNKLLNTPTSKNENWKFNNMTSYNIIIERLRNVRFVSDDALSENEETLGPGSLVRFHITVIVIKLWVFNYLKLFENGTKWSDLFVMKNCKK